MPYVAAEERRRQLIDAAIKVIGREGAARATTRRIVTEAGASLASLHYSFRDKRELFEAVIERCQQLTVARFDERRSSELGIANATHALLKDFVDLARDGVEFHVAQFELLLWAMRTPSAAAFAPAIYQGYFRLFEEILARAVSDGEDPALVPALSRALMTVSDGVVLQILALGAEGPSDADVERYAELALLQAAGALTPMATTQLS